MMEHDEGHTTVPRPIFIYIPHQKLLCVSIAIVSTAIRAVMVELVGLEPTTLCVQGRCAPNCAIAPCGLQLNTIGLTGGRNYFFLNKIRCAVSITRIVSGLHILINSPLAFII